jgi:hypothetical protein
VLRRPLESTAKSGHPVAPIHSTIFAFQNPHNGTGLPLRRRMRAVGRVMLNNLSEQIRDCLQHAEDCARKAAAQTDPTLKADFLDLERRWLVLARSYDFTERLNSFSKYSPKPNIKPNGKAI